MTLLPSMRTKEQLLEDEKALLAEIERLRDEIKLDEQRVADLMGDVNKAGHEIERLREHIKAVEKWHEQGKKLFDNYSVGLGAMFGLGKWWGERPWGAGRVR